MITKKNIFEKHLAEWLKAKRNRQKRGEMIKYISQTVKINSRSVGRSFKRHQMNKVGGTKKMVVLSITLLTLIVPLKMFGKQLAVLAVNYFIL